MSAKTTTAIRIGVRVMTTSGGLCHSTSHGPFNHTLLLRRVAGAVVSRNADFIVPERRRVSRADDEQTGIGPETTV